MHLTSRCASLRGVKLRGVHPTVESSFAVCIPLRSWTPRCAAHHGDKLRGVHHTAESSASNISFYCVSIITVAICIYICSSMAP